MAWNRTARVGLVAAGYVWVSLVDAGVVAAPTVPAPPVAPDIRVEPTASPSATS